MRSSLKSETSGKGTETEYEGSFRKGEKSIMDIIILQTRALRVGRKVNYSCGYMDLFNDTEML